MSYSDSTLAWATPLVRDWFLAKFQSPTEPQIQGWPSILAGQSTLIAAPTGSGKTFAAFLICLDQLVRQALAGTLTPNIEVLYVSPLKALGNDVQKNLMEPLAEILAMAEQRGHPLQEIKTAVRTGDTLMRERRQLLKHPPHILVTTPESLYILLTAEKSRPLLKNIKTVIVDEIHALVNNKRGAHLALSLERLEVLCESPLVRIGLSATQKPIDDIARFLTGNRPLPTIMDIGHVKPLDLAVEVPKTPLSQIASNEMWEEIYDRLAQLVQQHRSTLIFVNTRRLAERIAHHLTLRLGEDQVAAHHGSLSRKLRLTAETRLKQGDLAVLVATASLELGIDIGSVDLVCQISSPRAIAIALQRVGRAGHWRGAISKGRFFPTTRDDLFECAALIHAIKQQKLDRLLIPRQPLDILMQQIIATCATQEWQEKDLFDLVKRAAPYADLSPATFEHILTLLSEGIAGSRGRYGVYLHRDLVNGMIRARRGSRMIAITCGGAIADNGLFTVVTEPDETVVGTLDEDFAVESNRGDIMLLGTTSWRILRVESGRGRVIVENAQGAPPSVPFWRGEAPARTAELSAEVAQLRQTLSDLLPAERDANSEAIAWLVEHCGVSTEGAEQMIHYLRQGRTALGTVPTQNRIIAERFFDEAGGMQLVIHAPLGGRINKAWGLALRKRFCRSFNFELQAQATEEGLNISLAEQHSFPLADVFRFLHPNTIAEVLTQAVLQSPLFTSRWRWNATRALALAKFRSGKQLPPNIIRMLAEDLLAAVFPDAAACQDNLGGKDIELPDHLLVNETLKDIMEEALDLEGLKNVLDKIQQGQIECLAVDTSAPSPFACEILNANPYAFLDDAPLEERRARAVQMRRLLPDSVLQSMGALDSKAIIAVQKHAWPDIRNPDELHDALNTLILLPLTIELPAIAFSFAQWQSYFEQLKQTGRVGLAEVDGAVYGFAIEKYPAVQAIFPHANIQTFSSYVSQAHAENWLLEMIRGWMLHLGPITVTALSRLLSVDSQRIHATLIQLETTGFILQGKFSGLDEMEWCERRLLARIHRQTLQQLRQEIAPITSEQFKTWLLKWQHVAPSTQLSGESGLLEVIQQLQGLEMPAKAWEKVFAQRVTQYDSRLLDKLCLSGQVGWGRFSVHPAFRAQLSESSITHRVMPTSVAPITFFLRHDPSYLAFFHPLEAFNLEALSHAAQAIYTYLQKHGASFFLDIARVVQRLPAEIEQGLWELVTAGLVTSDDFDNLRALIHTKRRTGQKRYAARQRLPRNATGRWALLSREGSETMTGSTLESICRLLLKRYGVVFRDVLESESLLPPWGVLLKEFRQLEQRGDIRGGHFVSGFSGEQFALPYVIDSLRISRAENPI
ncbi:MAG: DEAD/DEAH box helicase [Gammaproteobacteria bacterium]